MEVSMAKVLKIPEKVLTLSEKDEFAGPADLIAQKMKQEGFGDESIQIVVKRLRDYREKYLMACFAVNLEGMDWSPETEKKVEALLEKLVEQIHDLTNRILEERISVEIALLDFDRD